MNNEDMLAKLWRRIERHGDCWIWTGALQPTSGRPVLTIGKTPRGIQKVMWEIYNGAIGGVKRQYALNSCGNDKCVNPAHLFLSSDPADTRRVSCIFRVQKKFWGKVKVETLDGCWEWQGALRPPMGYGAVRVHGKDTSAHRFIWELYRGQIPGGLLVRHKCDNPKCVNLLHLELGTHTDNTRDMIDRGRRADNSGEKSSSKFTNDQVRDMRARHANGEAYIDIANRYNSNKYTIRSIVKRITWKYLP